MTNLTSTSHNLWCNRSFAVWTLSAAQSQFGTALSSIALSFLVLHETGSVGGLSLTLALSLAPNILMPLAGAYIDRIGVKMPLVLSDAARGVLQLALAGAALLLGDVPVAVIYAVALLSGLVGAFAHPAGSSALPLLVESDDLQRANGIMESLRNGAWLAGYAAGGALVAAFGPAWALALDGATYLLAAGAVAALVHFRPQGAEGGGGAIGERGSLWADIRGGLALMRQSRVLMLIPALGLLLNAAFAPTLALVPAVMERLGHGAAGYSLFLMLETGGGIFSGLLFAKAAAHWPARGTMLAGFVLAAMALAGTAWVGNYAAYLAGAALLGLAFGLINTPIASLLGRLVPPSHLGRVFSILGMTSTLGMPLALVAMTPFADSVPAEMFFAIAAACMVLGGAAWWLGTSGELDGSGSV